MANWTENDLKRQFERAKKNGWIKTFKSAAATYQLPPEVLMAITSRETNMRNIIEDGGHGYGLMQIDDRSFPEWCNSGLWKGPARWNPKWGSRPSQQATNHSEWAG
jgi:hypothetical protein